MTTKRYSLGGGGGFDSLSQVLDQLLQIQQGGGGAPAEQKPQGAAPSAAPPGGSVPSAGTTPTMDMSKVNMQAPIPKGMPKAAGQTGQLMGEPVGGGVQTPPSGGGQFASGGSTIPTGDYSTLDTSGYSLGTTGSGTTGGGTEDTGGGAGDFISGLGELADTATQIYETFSMDEQEKSARAARHLDEQKFAIRQNWKKVYEDINLPIQTGTKMYAYQQLGKDSEQYQYATNMLKGMIEGSASVYAGQKDWEQVWDELGKIPEEMVPDTFMESFQSHYQDDTVNNAAWWITSRIIEQIAPGLPKGFANELGLEILKIGNATMKAALDMRV